MSRYDGKPRKTYAELEEELRSAYGAMYKANEIANQYKAELDALRSPAPAVPNDGSYIKNVEVLFNADGGAYWVGELWKDGNKIGVTGSYYDPVFPVPPAPAATVTGWRLLDDAVADVELQVRGRKVVTNGLTTAIDKLRSAVAAVREGSG